MHQIPFEQQFLALAQAAALVALCARLCVAGLQRVYPFLFAYLLATLLQSFAPFVAPLDSVLYRDTWLLTETLIVCLYVLVVLELYSIVLRDRIGMLTLSRRYRRMSLAIAIVGSLSLLVIEKHQGGLATHFLVFERAVLLSLVLFILLLTALLAFYPVPLKRNVIVYSIGYAVYFVAKASALFVNNLGYYWNRELSDVRLIACLACLIFWLFALNRRGESETLIVGHRWTAEHETRVLQQLNTINSTLSRTTRK